MNNKQQPSSNKDFFLRYASLGTQILAGIGLSVFIGLKTDHWLHTLPLFSCVLPLLLLCGMFYKLYRETSKRNQNEK
jgi:F0F1-type ATP synthase assembly protein I